MCREAVVGENGAMNCALPGFVASRRVRFSGRDFAQLQHFSVARVFLNPCPMVNTLSRHIVGEIRSAALAEMLGMG